MELVEFEKSHNSALLKYQNQIKKLYNEAVIEASNLAVSVDVDFSKPFTFSYYPETAKRFKRLMRKIERETGIIINNGTQTEWNRAIEKHNTLISNLDIPSLFSFSNDEITKEQNKSAYNAFKTRSTNGLNLSDRVWRTTEQFKIDIENSIDIAYRDKLNEVLSGGIATGMSPAELSRRVRSYLNNPTALYRRVRDEHGELQLSKNAKNYHSGRGVYRSAYKNALRLTATETNIAYRTSDYLRYQTEDFVLGITIELSNNHTLNGKPFFDMCNELAGNYPKDFKFVGWHPNCRCHVLTILPTPQEMLDYLNNGTPFKRIITDVPDNFKKWMSENGTRYANYKTTPYFIADNPKYVDANSNKQANTNSRSLRVTTPTKDEVIIYDDKTVYKFEGSKGTLTIPSLVNENDSDFKKLFDIAENMARQGKKVMLPPKKSRKYSFDYNEYYKDLVGTPFEGKCPDIAVRENGKWVFYEFESYNTTNPKRALKNMLKRGSEQCDKIIIDTIDITDAKIRSSIFGRINNGEIITEVWMYANNGKIRNIYKQ